MIDASSAKRSLKRFVGYVEEIMEISEVESKDSALTEFIQYVSENREIIREAATEETSQLISYLVVNVYKSGSKKLDELLTVVREVDPENHIVGEYEIVSLLDKNDYTEIIRRVTADTKYCTSEGIMDVLRKSSMNSGEFIPVVKYYAKCNLFDAEVFSEYAEKSNEDEADDAIISSYEAEGNQRDLVSFLELIVENSRNIAYKVKLVKLYLEEENKEGLSKLVRTIDPSDIEELGDYITISNANEYVEDYARSLLFANSGLASYKADRDLMLQKARMLMLLSREGDATEVLSELVENYPKDHDSIRLVSKICYRSGDYKNTLKYMGLLGELTDYELQDYIIMVDSEISLSYFDEATRHIKKAQATFGKDIEILKYKLKLEKIINDQAKAHSTALEILKVDPAFEDALDIKYEYLFDKEEYRDFVEELDEVQDEEIRTRFLDRYGASLIYLNRFQAFISLCGKKNDLMDTGCVVDALFYTVRDDEKIASLRALINQTHGRNGAGLKIVLNRLQGMKPPFEGDATELAISMKSFALAYIISMESIDFVEKSTSPMAEALLSTSRFKELSATVDVLRDIHSGKISNRGGISDSPRLLYPVVSALIEVGSLDDARNVLDNSYDSRASDPFYFHLDAILQFRKGNSVAARKSIRKAISKLSNNTFLTLEAEILLSGDDLDDVQESLVNLGEKGLIQNINFEEVYNYIFNKGNFLAGQSMINALKPFNVDNFWLNKLSRDIRVQKADLEGALEFSTLVVTNRKRSFDDVRKHVEILDQLGMKKERLAFLLANSGEHESSMIDLWLGDSYYEERDYESALEYYEAAIEKGVEPPEILNYADTLLENGKLERAAKLIKTMSDPGILRVKLYYEQGNTEGIISLLKSSDLVENGEEGILTYLAEKLWSNRLVRTALIKAYRSEGYLFLGRLISRKMVENEDYDSAVDILKNLLKNYPQDIESVALLADIYSRLGRVTEALDLMLNSMKNCTDFEQSMSLVDRIQRIYYEERDYDAVIKFYTTNREHVDSSSIQYVIRSYIAKEEFDEAEKLLGKYEGNLVDRQLNKEMLQEIKAKREFSEILIYVRRLLKLEYKAGKVFDMKEALYKAEIPIEKIEDVFAFLSSEEYYQDINEEKYEILSRDVFQEIARKTRVQSLKEVRINIIFNNLPSRDAVVAKNLYIYIKRSLQIVREPKTQDDVLSQLLKIALRDNLRPEPLNIAVNLNVGISDALEVIALMRYMEDMNSKGGP